MRTGQRGRGRNPPPAQWRRTERSETSALRVHFLPPHLGVEAPVQEHVAGLEVTLDEVAPRVEVQDPTCDVYREAEDEGRRDRDAMRRAGSEEVMEAAVLAEFKDWCGGGVAP